MPKKKRSDQFEASVQIEEAVAEVFCSNRRTGQIGDFENRDDLDYSNDAVGSQNQSASGDDWTVHDFADSRD